MSFEFSLLMTLTRAVSMRLEWEDRNMIRLDLRETKNQRQGIQTIFSKTFATKWGKKMNGNCGEGCIVKGSLLS